MAVRLRDIAELAGVSIKTASNAINGAGVKPSTQAKVDKAIAELGYRPNLSARQLKYGRTGMITLAIPDLDAPYFADLATRFTQAAVARSWIPVFEVTRGDPAAERSLLQGPLSHMVDGVIFSPLVLTARQIAARPDNVPMVLLGERPPPAGYDHVGVDSAAAAQAMTEHLIGMGRRRIAAIGVFPSSTQGTDQVRLSGYRSALDSAGLRYRDDYVKSAPVYSREDGRRAMLELLSLRQPPDAVFCFTDAIAAGALRACHERGVRIAQDVAIGGFDDIPETRYTTPSLTTITPDLDRLVETALDLLLDRIEHPGTSRRAKRPKIGWELTIRESTTG